MKTATIRLADGRTVTADPDDKAVLFMLLRDFMTPRFSGEYTFDDTAFEVREVVSIEVAR